MQANEMADEKKIRALITDFFSNNFLANVREHHPLLLGVKHHKPEKGSNDGIHTLQFTLRFPSEGGVPTRSMDSSSESTLNEAIARNAGTYRNECPRELSQAAQITYESALNADIGRGVFGTLQVTTRDSALAAHLKRKGNEFSGVFSERLRLR